MPYLMLSDDHSDDTRILSAGPLAAWLHTCALVYCAKAMSDGFIPSGQLRRLADVDHAQQLAEILVRVGLWSPAVGGWQIPDYLGRHANHSRAQIDEYRAKKAEQMAQSRARRERKAPVTGNRGGNLPGTFPANDRSVTREVPAPAPAPTPHLNQPLPLPPLPMSSSTAPRYIAPGYEDVDLLLLRDLTTVFLEQHEIGRLHSYRGAPTAIATGAGLDPEHDPAHARTVEVAVLTVAQMDEGIGMERRDAERIALAQPAAVADWLNNPDRWERARNPAGLLRARLDPTLQQQRKEQPG